MVTEKEQQPGAGEQTTAASEQEPESASTEPTSVSVTETETANEKTEPKLLPEDEIERRAQEKAERLAQSKKDKELKPLYEKLEALEAERKAEREAKERAEVDRRIAAQEEVERKKLEELGLPIEDIEDFQKRSRAVREKERQLNDFEGQAKQILSEANTKAQQAAAVDSIVRFLAKKNPDLQAEVEALREQLKEAKTPREAELLMQVWELGGGRKAEKPAEKPRPPSHKPDSSVTTSSGGGDYIPTDIPTLRQWITDHPDLYRKNRDKVHTMLKNEQIK